MHATGETQTSERVPATLDVIPVNGKMRFTVKTSFLSKLAPGCYETAGVAYCAGNLGCQLALITLVLPYRITATRLVLLHAAESCRIRGTPLRTV